MGFFQELINAHDAFFAIVKPDDSPGKANDDQNSQIVEDRNEAT